MTSSEFINKFKSKYLWGNIGAMILVLVLLCVGVKYGIDIYTHHGEAIRVPDIRYKNIDDATHILDDAGLEIVVTDTGYVRSLPPIIKSIYYRITFTKIIHYIAKVKRLANYYFFSMFAFSNP
jgi:hypothetical protein